MILPLKKKYFYFLTIPFLILLFLFSGSGKGFSQELSDTLGEVKIINRKKGLRTSDERLRDFSPGLKIVSLDSQTLAQYQMQSVQSLLQQQSPVFIKSYGVNGLATLNIRGASAAQSLVFWNGMPVNNAASGIADVSLLPVSMMNQVHLAYGSSSALFGSGNVGGALLLETAAPEFKNRKKYELALGAGSYGQYQGSGRLELGFKKLILTTDVFLQTARNDFRYEDDFNDKKQTGNAALKSIALQQSIALKAGEKNVFRLIAWYQDYYREIPAALFESSSMKNRNDESFRILLDWNHFSRAGKTYIKTGFSKENFLYDDAAVNLHTSNEILQVYAEAGWKKNISSRHQMLIFTPIEIAYMPFSDKKYSKSALAAAFSYSSPNNRFVGAFNGRLESIQTNLVFLPGINASFEGFRGLNFKANIQKTYRAPTLNELYFNPGGNENLKPENGWSADLGYVWEQKKQTGISLRHEIAAFGRKIDDWILWFGGAIWTPHNIASVFSRGIETDNYLSWSHGSWKFHLGARGNYILATTVSSYVPNDGSIGKQIPYSPRTSAQANIGCSWKGFYFNLNQTYTGFRFINTDESGKLPSYHTTNLQTSYRLEIKDVSVQFFLQTNNLWDASYQVMNGRPMPGFNWLFSVRVQGS